MQTYVAEIEGFAVIAFRAADDAQAQMSIAAEKMRAEISLLENVGWRTRNGQVITVRPATFDEDNAWKENSLWVSGEDKGFDTNGLVMFIVPVTNPS
jgi:hypothetical protein